MRDPRRWLVLAAIAAALAVLAIPTIDEPIARAVFAHDTHRGLWNDGISVLEYPAGLAPWAWLGACVLVAGALATSIVPRWRTRARGWQLVALVHLLARAAVTWMKPAIGRLRPWQWLVHGGGTFFRGGASFPSGHVVLFASLALPIAAVWPRGRVPAFAIVGFVMLARVAVDAHFASDVLAGLAVVAALTAAWLPLLRLPPPR